MIQLYAVIIILVLLSAVIFVGYYVIRLLDARRAVGGRARGTSSRALHTAANRFPHDPPVTGLSTSRPLREGVEDGPGAVRVHEGTTGLRQISSEPVFLRQTRAGEITVQVDTRPALPLRYVLDARMRSVLERVARQATSDYGRAWAVLAEEDARGRLKLTRLG